MASPGTIAGAAGRKGRTITIAGAEQAAKVLDETLPSNDLMPQWYESEGKPL